MRFSEYVTPDDPLVKEIASRLKTPSDAFHWVCTNLYYRREEKDYWRLPRETIEVGFGDCEDLANTLTSILRAMGYNARSVIYKIKYGGREYYHVVTKLGNLILDPSLKKINPSWLYYAEPIVEYDETGIFLPGKTGFVPGDMLAGLKNIVPFVVGLAGGALVYKWVEPINKRVAGVAAVATALGLGYATYQALAGATPEVKASLKGVGYEYIPGYGRMMYADIVIPYDFILKVDACKYEPSSCASQVIDLLRPDVKDILKKVSGKDKFRLAKIVRAEGEWGFTTDTLYCATQPWRAWVTLDLVKPYRMFYEIKPAWPIPKYMRVSWPVDALVATSRIPFRVCLELTSQPALCSLDKLHLFFRNLKILVRAYV